MTSTITNIILDSIAQKSNLLDSFVVSYATIVSGIYRLKGVDGGKCYIYIFGLCNANVSKEESEDVYKLNLMYL